MFTVITDFGAQCLDLARLQDKRIEFIRFELGLLKSPIPDVTPETFDLSAYTVLRDSVYFAANYKPHWSGTQADMVWIPAGTDRVNLKCFVPAGLDFFRFNTTVIYARCNGQTGVFMFSHYLVENPKFALEMSTGGMRYWFQVNLQFTDILGRFIWGNLSERMVSWLEQPSWFDLDEALKVREDQGVLTEHGLSPHVTGPQLIINSEEQWYGVGMQPVDLSDSTAKDLVIGQNEEVYSRRDGWLPPGWKWVVTDTDAPVLDYQGNPRIERI